MKQSKYYISFLSASGVFIYVASVAWFLFNGEAIFGEGESFIIPLFMMLLFVISAAVTGLLVLGKPIHMYLSGSKKEAFTVLFATLGWLVLFLIIIVLALISI